MNEKTTVKILTINPAERCSLQYHNHRTEFWKIIEGEAILQIGEQSIDSMIGDEYEIGIGVKHRITGKDAVTFTVSWTDPTTIVISTRNV